MRNILELGIRPRKKNGLLIGPASREAIAIFERKYAVSLPNDYIDFLSVANGGVPKLQWYKDASKGRDLLIESFFYLGEMETEPTRPSADGWDSGNLWAETRVRREVLTTADVPFGRNGGDDIFFLRCEHALAPVMILSGDTRAVDMVSDEFSAFVDGLYERHIRRQSTSRR